jgi:hypothetical protein
MLSRTLKPGLVYEVYAGAFDRLPDFESVNPSAAGVTPNVGLHVLPLTPDGQLWAFGMEWVRFVCVCVCTS